MADFDDFQRIDSPVEQSSGALDNRRKWAIVVALVIVAVGLVGYIATRRYAAPGQQAPVQQSASSRPDVALAPEPVTTLPPLSETDSVVRQMVTQLSSHPKILAWLTTNGLLENFTVVTLNISEGRNPKRHLQTLTLSGPFRVRRAGGVVQLDPRNYERYNEYAAAVDGLDVDGVARLYQTLRPRIRDAYRQLGYPEGDFDRVLDRAIRVLAQTPVIGRDVTLHQTVVGSYEFSDPTIEELSPPQKQLLRMGPDNMRIIQAKLREIAARLNLPSS